ncbi:transposase [Streptomyces sp. NPDC101149]|uniref:IS110 family transposase n=1 Tax=Streptomyces sp. NPDC101149 TaxID=3366113 RepID=UPI003821A292
MADETAGVGGVDTHTDFHQAAVIDSIGRHLTTHAFPTTPDDYHRLLDWLRSHGDLIAVGVEGTGAYGSGLARHLRDNQVTVIEVDRPDRRARRAGGKSDPIDAFAAATAVLTGRASGTPKARHGIVEATRALRVVRRSAESPNANHQPDPLPHHHRTRRGPRTAARPGSSRIDQAPGPLPSRHADQRPCLRGQGGPAATGPPPPIPHRGDRRCRCRAESPDGTSGA